MITCTRRLTFCAGHRVMGHENKCAHLHGHNYVVEATACGNDGVDALGRVIDFSIIKQWLGGWLDTNFDHGFILHVDDTAARNAVENFQPRKDDKVRIYQKVFLMPMNPTAENIADYLLQMCAVLFEGSGVRITHIRLHETENCYADVTL